MRSRLARTSDSGPTIAIGIAIAIVLPIAAFIAAITLIGLPLAIGIGLALLPLGTVAYLVAAYALGRRMVEPPRHRMLSFLAGLGALRVAAYVPDPRHHRRHRRSDSSASA